jgi:transaldolase
MQLFLDSSSPKEILEARSWGLLSGVTTNPSLISAAGPDKEATLRAILEASPGPVFVQAIGWRDPAPLVAQARWLHAFSDRIIVKLPISIAGIQALQQLKRERPTLRVAITAVASIAQAYLCGKAGADVVAIFNGPLDQVSDTPVELVGQVRRIYDNYGFQTKILSCGRFPRLFGEVAAAGTDICTMKIEFMRMLYEHPFTDKRMLGFLADWQGAFGDCTWPEAQA